MVRRIVLLSVIALVSGALIVQTNGAVAIADSAGCTQVDFNSGTCVSGTIDDGAAVLTGNTGTGNGGDGGDTDDGASVPADPNAQCLVVVAGRCLYDANHGAVTQPITLADIAAFRPDAGVDHMEPNGWMIVGLTTNFYATGGTQVKDGTLLGQPASVRFTPQAWHWTYGDGSQGSAGTPGGSWASTGIAEFDPTPTGHIYRAAGTYYIDLTIDYSAEYRFAGTQWIAIAGILPVPANRLVATAGGAKTVLVERECTANPQGPGC